MSPDRFTVENLKTALSRPTLIWKEGKRILLSKKNGYHLGSGIDVMSEDWDNLIILDACRYDYFEEISNIRGDLQEVTSKGTSSWGFVKHNFKGRSLHDTVAVTANPFYNRLSPTTFHAVHSTLESFADEDNKKIIGSIENYNPGKVTEAALTAQEDFPNKRLVVHYMQPHQPFIGPTGEKLREKIKGTEYERTDRKIDYIEWDTVNGSLITVEEVRSAYAENLEIVLEDVSDLLTRLRGKSVVTADHGELLGERVFGKREWGHGFEKEVKEVRQVPWLTVDAPGRKKINAEEPVNTDRIDQESVSRHLEALGYK